MDSSKLAASGVGGARRKGLPGVVYVLSCDFGTKIGFTNGSVQRRMAELFAKFDFCFVCAIHCDNAFGLEQHLHRRFAEKRKRAWWSTEMFELDSSDLEYITSITSFEGKSCRMTTGELEADLVRIGLL